MSCQIDVRGIGKRFDTDETQVVALSPLDISIREGELFSLIGPSGCGKTTLLRIIGGLTAPSQGHVDIGGKRVTGPDRRISLVFQKATLLPWRSIMQNILLPVQIGRQMSIGEARERARSLLELMGIEAFADSLPSQLSGGMQQRAAIARALVTDPQILLMDEPFSALDEFTRERLNDELHRIHRQNGKTILFVTHNISEAVFLSDRIGVMAPRPGRLGHVVDLGSAPRERDAAFRKDRRFFDLVTETRSAFDTLLQPGAAKA